MKLGRRSWCGWWGIRRESRGRWRMRYKKERRPGGPRHWPSCAKSGGGRRIAAEQHAVVARLNQVAVVSAIRIAVHARAPMIHLERAQPDVCHPRALAP